MSGSTVPAPKPATGARKADPDTRALRALLRDDGSSAPAHRGVTLVELLVAIAIVGLLAGVVGLAARGVPEPSEAERLAAVVADARRSALREKRPATIEIRLGDAPHAVTALPDGRVVADRAVRERLGLDGLTGVVLGPEEGARVR